MLDRGVMLPPSQQEAWFISSAHGESDLDQTKDAALIAFGAELGDKLAKQLEAKGANSPARQPRPTALTPEIVAAPDGEELEVTKSFSVG
jgi:glutamate-1-semialdehyde aminotransferase